ncbi:DUF3995 domain-containing protein [Corynebacterium doosanense]|uniref:DUF3995 domain-containing protein n=2 Tax=Corynebacterium doosanense TaxID=1121358 RepID=UPI0026CFD53B
MSRFTQYHPERGGWLRNRHERITPGMGERSEDLVSGLAGSGDRVWPSQWWTPIRLDRGLQLGSEGGHGSVPYRVTELQPGRSVTFTFAQGFPLLSSHRLWFEALDDGKVRWVHDLDFAAPRTHRERLFQAWVIPLHDGLLEDLLDNTEREQGGCPPRPGISRRVLRWLDGVVERQPESRSTRARRRPVAIPTATVLVGTGVLHAAWGAGASWPADDRSTLAHCVIGTERVPGPIPCSIVAILLGVTAAATTARVAPELDRRPHTTGLLDVFLQCAAAILALRGISGIVWAVFGRPSSTATEFHRANLMVYSPLCLALASGLFATTSWKLHTHKRS